MLKKIIIGLIAVSAAACNVQAQENNYTVRDISVSATAEDANNARMAAMGQAEEKAFSQLLARFMPPEQAAARQSTMQPQTISSLVTGYEVKNEKLSARSYSASIDVSFDPQKVANILHTAPVAPTAGTNTMQSAPHVLVPPPGVTAADSTPANGHITLLSRLSSVRDWVVLRKKLSSISAVAHIELTAISQQQADMVVDYRGTLPQFESALAAAGLVVKKNPNYWIIGL